MRYNNDHLKPNTERSTGFTLVELLIVVSFIAILASITVPNLISSRARASEAVVVQFLKTLCTGQQLMKSRGVLDMNKNSTAEYGFVGELSGMRPLRGIGDYLDPPSVNASVGSIDPKGFGSKGGSVYRLYLPDASGVGVPETAALLATVDPALSESFYTVLAWPSAYGSSGQRTFFMNQSGEIVSTVDPNYSGKSSPPVANAALIGVAPGVIATNSIASAGQVGVDGNRWKSTR